MPICVSLRGLDREALIRILQEPKNALVKQYQKLFQMDNVELSFEQDAIEAIADKALERKTGARGLRSIMESVMMDTMYEIPSDDTIEECVVTKAAVDGESEPLTIHDESLKRQNNPGAALWSHRAAFCAKSTNLRCAKAAQEWSFMIIRM